MNYPKIKGSLIILLWVDILAMYAMYMMMAYLTNVWKLGFTRAAAIVNVFWGVTTILPLPLAFLVETITGNYWMLLLSSFSYSAGLGFLAMSTPPVLGRTMGRCREYNQECIGQGQRILFYTALPLIAFGMSGHMTCWNSFMAEQFIRVEGEVEDEDEFDNAERTFWKFFYSVLATIVLTFVAVLGLPYIKPWSIRFGIPAICTLVATLLFFSGSCSYKYFSPLGCPLTVFFRVFVAAVSKLFYRIPRDPKELFEVNHPQLYVIPHTKSLRCLDKAAVVIPTKPLEEQAENPWRLCTVTEVEETKTIIRMIPVWMTFILCGVVNAIGFTYFVEQLDHLDHKVGRLKLPSVALLWFFDQTQNQIAKLYVMLANRLAQSGSIKFAPPLGIAVSMILAILCCITAAKVEDRRLGVVQRHGLVEKPDETVPMTMFWLLPQFVLLGASTGIFNYSALCFFVDQSPVSTRRYLPFMISAVFGVGILGSVVSVFVAGKVSERGGKRNWFQHDLNGSRLDKYYWSLAWLMAVNLVVFVVVAIFYRYKESELQDLGGGDFGGIDEGYDENSKCCCCLC
ncbi:protein NRT1/ PTR FAMILY 5.5-like isoform X1 [Salvia hispanica]|uniref:protein NRT1/ PTR FAMILY 5.5-like isoform X1 n=1 Tax=Salvia hispanica TaxID=49212 RepID=UPI0020095CCC|nr:protein NRT1/ PTR FAMILY 5.5-like isoform X1 [Salvia hispanica]